MEDPSNTDRIRLLGGRIPEKEELVAKLQVCMQMVHLCIYPPVSVSRSTNTPFERFPAILTANHTTTTEPGGAAGHAERQSDGEGGHFGRSERPDQSVARRRCERAAGRRFPRSSGECVPGATEAGHSRHDGNHQRAQSVPGVFFCLAV